MLPGNAEPAPPGPNPQEPRAPAGGGEHTPGPWRFDVGDRKHYHTNERLLILPPHGSESESPIAKLPECYGGTQRGYYTSEANARLIAAAPELYKRLKALLADVEAEEACWCSGASDDCPHPPACEACQAREVLAALAGREAQP